MALRIRWPVASTELQGLLARQQGLQRGTQAVDVRLRCRLCLAVLLRRGIARRPERHRIPGLPWCKATSDAKVDQVEMAHGGAHDIAGLDVAEDDGGLTGVEVPQHGAQLHADSEDLRNGQMLAFGGLDNLLRAEMMQGDGLDSNKRVMAPHILRLVDRAEAACANDPYDTVATGKQSRRGSRLLRRERRCGTGVLGGSR